MIVWKHRVEFGSWHDKPAEEHAFFIYQALARDRALIDYSLESNEDAIEHLIEIMDELDRRPLRYVEGNLHTLMPLSDAEFDDILDRLYDWGDKYRICIG